MGIGGNYGDHGWNNSVVHMFRMNNDNQETRCSGSKLGIQGIRNTMLKYFSKMFC